jgi:hypothetical protein
MSSVHTHLVRLEGVIVQVRVNVIIQQSMLQRETVDHQSELQDLAADGRGQRFKSGNLGSAELFVIIRGRELIDVHKRLGVSDVAGSGGREWG